MTNDSKKVSYSKLIARQHSCYRNVWPWFGSCSTLQKLSSHLAFDHRAKFGHVRACESSLKILGTLRPRPLRIWVVSDPLETCPFIHMSRQIWSFSVKRYERNYGNAPGKNWPFASRLSRWLKVFGTDTDRSATYDFLSAINSNHEHIVPSLPFLG